MKSTDSYSTSGIKYQKKQILLIAIGPILVILLVFGYVYFNESRNQSSAATGLLFDGTLTANWGKQVTSTCGSFLKDISTTPPNQSGSSIAVFIKDGCRWSNDDSNKERAELSTANGQLDFSQGDIWYIDFWQKFDQLADIHPGSDWDIWLQTHFRGGGNQPNLIMATDGNNRMVFKTSQGCGHSAQWIGSPITESKWYHFTLGVKFSNSSSDGWVQLSLDGKEVLPKKAVAVLGSRTASCSSGGTIFDATTGYLKKGIYRNASTSGDEGYTLYGLRVYSSDPNPASSSPSPSPAPLPTPNSQQPSPRPTPSPSPSPEPVPVIIIPGSSSEKPVLIPDDLATSLDGTLVADFDGEGHNDVAVDYNNDGNIDPSTEIIVDGSINKSLTDTNGEPLLTGASDSVFDDYAEVPASTKEDVISIKAGPLPEFKVSKPIIYTFAGLQAITISGLVAYFAVTKLTIFSAIRTKIGL